MSKAPGDSGLLPPSCGPANGLSNEDLVSVALESYGRSFIYPSSEVNHDRWVECRAELLSRLARLADSQPVPDEHTPSMWMAMMTPSGGFRHSGLSPNQCRDVRAAVAGLQREALKATRQIVAEYPEDGALQIQAKAIDAALSRTPSVSPSGKEQA